MKKVIFVALIFLLIAGVSYAHKRMAKENGEINHGWSSPVDAKIERHATDLKLSDGWIIPPTNAVMVKLR